MDLLSAKSGNMQMQYIMTQKEKLIAANLY